MKFCQKCGKELLDEAVICVGCGCAAEGKVIKNEPRMSTFIRNRQQWIIALSIVFAIFAVVTVLILTSSEFNKADQVYTYLHSDLAKFGTQFSTQALIKWEMEIKAAKAEVLPYYIGIGVCSVFALSALIGDIILLVNKKKGKKSL